MGAASDLLHYVVAEVAGQTVEDWVLGEVDELIAILVVGYLDLKQAFLEVAVQAPVGLHLLFNRSFNSRFPNHSLIQDLSIRELPCSICLLLLKLLVNRG